MKSFSDLRNQSAGVASIAKALTDKSTKKNFDDARFWQAALDKAGNGQALIRFLPPPVDEQDSFIQYWSHGFKGPGGWFIENCATTIGLPCPVCEDNGVHWQQGEDGQKFVRERGSKRKLNFVTNVLVLKDPANPDNEGKVFLFKYGQKIQQKYEDAIVPPFEGDEAYLPYDFWAGANFKLRIVKKDGFSNFDQSVFEGRTPVKGTDGELEAIWKAQHSLKEFIDPEKKFKSYNDLTKQLSRALGASTGNLGGKTIEESLQAISGKTADAPVTHKVAELVSKEELESIPDDLSASADSIESLRNLIK